MNEYKRFTIHGDVVSDTDMKIPITLWSDKKQQKKFCDELNNLADENEQLKKAERRLYKYFRKCFDNVSDEGFRETWEVVKNNDENKRFILVDIGFIRDNGKFIGMKDIVAVMNELHEENQQLKSDLARVIEQARKNNELCVSDIRILEKALWCSSCENDYNRLRQLRKEFLK